MEWESKVSPLPYYRGNWQDAVPTSELSPGIYLLRNCQEISPQSLEDLGWQFLLDMADLAAIEPVDVTFNPTIQVSPLTPDDVDFLVEAAPRIFSPEPYPNRVHRLWSRPVADTLMTEWVLNSLTERAARVRVAHRDGEPAGFVSILSISDNVEQIDLLGVCPGHRGLGVGKTLANLAALTAQTSVMRVRTELTNLPAMWTYMAAGFQLIQSETQYWARVEKES